MVRSPDPVIGPGEARRLSIALIGAHQSTRVRAGELDPGLHISKALAGRTGADIDDLGIDEATLGYDSLASLDLIMEVNRFLGLSATGIEDYLVVRPSLGDWADLIAQHFERVGEAAAITFASSGSTGTPKHSTHGLGALQHEAEAIAAIIGGAAPARRRVLSAVAPHHIFGFIWGVLLPRVLDAEPVDLFGAAPNAVARASAPGDLVLATPFLWKKYAEYGLTFAEDVIGVSSGGAADDAVWAAGERTGLALLIEAYGSTETAGIGTRSAPDLPFSVMPHLEVLAGTIRRVADEDPLALQDHIDWVGERQFALGGRLDGVVQVAGTNVDMGVVRQTMLDTGLVADAAVRLDGDKLKAFVVPKAGADIRPELREALTALPAVARPGRYTFGDEIPVDSVGKLQDWD